SVVLPLPFRPTSPIFCPHASRKLTPDRMVSIPNDLSILLTVSKLIGELPNCGLRIANCELAELWRRSIRNPLSAIRNEKSHRANASVRDGGRDEVACLAEVPGFGEILP